MGERAVPLRSAFSASSRVRTHHWKRSAYLSWFYWGRSPLRLIPAGKLKGALRLVEAGG
jgi:hypothetical protein